jgi:Flp pilus assembly protein TadD
MLLFQACPLVRCNMNMHNDNDAPGPLVRFCIREGKEVLAVLLIAAWVWTTRVDRHAMNAQPHATSEAMVPTTERIANQWSNHPAEADARLATVPMPPKHVEAGPEAIVATATSKPEAELAQGAVAPPAQTSKPVSAPEVHTVARRTSFEQTPAQRALLLLGAGIHRFWEGQYRLAIENFRDAHQCDPSDAATLYFLALSHRRLGEAAFARRALTAAVSAEARQPLPTFGQLMQRVQGTDRLWIEDLRR